MDDALPQAKALAIDSGTGRITAIRSLSEVKTAAPGAAVTDLGSTVLMPGFVEPHSHPLLSGMATQKPACWVSPMVGVATWDDVKAIFATADRRTRPIPDPGLQRRGPSAPAGPLPTRSVLDEIFPARPVVVIDNSGHGICFNSPTLALLGWPDGKPPADPVGGSFASKPTAPVTGPRSSPGAHADRGCSTAQGDPAPAAVRALFYQLMARCGITATSEHTWFRPAPGLRRAVIGARIALCDFTFTICRSRPDAAADVDFPKPELVRKNGIKLWADGSPWIGNVAISFEYLDNPTTRTAQMELGPRGESQMNYNRALNSMRSSMNWFRPATRWRSTATVTWDSTSCSTPMPGR